MDAGLRKTYLPDGRELRLFDDASIQDSVNKLLGDVPSDRSTALIRVGMDGVAVAGRYHGGEHWSVALFGKREWDGDLEAGVELKATW